MRRKLRKPSPSIVIACIALFVALAPAAYATHEVILSSDIVNGEVKTPDLANLAVTNGKLAPNSVATGKVVDNSLTGADVVESSLAKVPNADTLDGLDSSQLQRTGLVHSGRILQSEAEGYPRIFDWPELGVMLTGDGDADRDGSFVVWNLRTSGAIEVTSAGSLEQISAQTFTIIGNPNWMKTVFIAAPDDPTRTLLVTCTQSGFDGFEFAYVACEGVASRVG